ncbi:MAG: anthranilate phosphoribosyltransferase [Acidobacteria bacterium]|nr:anthranilate phosphoribosyltransferase [Acidobacteriota bacterium]
MRTAVDLKGLLKGLMDHDALPPAAVEGFFGALMEGAVDDVHAAAVLVALRMKGETGVELAAAARAMRARAVRVPLASPQAAVDTCGTGGDGADTINISTAAALVTAAAGVPVAKHGNRSVSSRCGSADVLEACGVRLGLSAEALGALVDEIGIAFLFAPPLHPAMRAVMPVRRALGVRTTFNLLGPLTNPAGVRRQVVGVWGVQVQMLVAEALAELDAAHALVVHSADGLDELSVAAPTTVVEVRDGHVNSRYEVDPRAVGIKVEDDRTLAGGDVEFNAERLRAVLAGEHSAASEAVALNAGAALYVGGAAHGIEDGVAMAREVLHSGRSAALLERLANRSQEHSQGE